jgi:hypothetical protein
MKKKETPFQENEWLETLLRIQRDDPKRFATFSQSLKVSLGHYERAKSKAHEQESNEAE